MLPDSSRLIDPSEILKTVFGYERFRGQQKEIIGQLLEGRDVLVLMPTGGGKSICYQIPAMIRNGVGVVISPLIALMQDQVNALAQLGVRAAYLNSTLASDQVREVERRLADNDLDLLYIAPERLNTPRTKALLKKIQIALFAIDEAHCVSQWGHDFRADYLQLSMLHADFPDIPRIALTATADVRTRREIVQRLGLGQAEVYIGGFDRPNIRYRIVQKQDARLQLLNFIRSEHAGDAGIVYCLSRRKVEATAEWLKGKGVEALPYHAGMDHESRHKHQHLFLMEEGLVMVATIAFGMGIDKSNVRFVAHLDLPKSIEAYYQETGRAGRDGLPANAWMAYGIQDVIALRQMLGASNAGEAHKRSELHKLDAMLGLCEQINCRRQSLLSYFGEVLERPCNNCDTCLEPVKTWDGTLAAQQALSCIYRTGQRFGVNYLIDVLLGKSNERIKNFGHDRQSTFGIGNHLEEDQWRSVFRQLVAKGLAAVDLDGHGGLTLSDACRPILRGEERLMLRRDLKPERIARARDRQNQRIEVADKRLWEALRDKRREIADAQDVPPYVIFHDATLMEMLETRPESLERMRQISGVGDRKLALYGEEFIAVLNEFAVHETVETYPSSTDTVDESLALFRLGFNAEQIAQKRGMKKETVYLHLSRAIEDGSVELKEAVGLSEREIASIQEAFLNLPEDRKIALKPVFDAFGGAYDYGVLRCIRAGMMKG
ncbi:MAG: DNA helicase RecQ [Gammaproteobacteria bacterium]